MDPVDDHFREVDKLLESVNKVTHCCVIDFHGEATSEKVAFGWYVDGRVSAVIGTHTHVQTADERILPQGTAYMTDMGMTGPYNSVIGMKCEVVLSRFTTLLPSKFEVADGPARLCGVFLNLNTDNGKAVEVKRINQEG
jgi:metallophosphoesterase (TIGR00282 family)